MSYNTEFQSNNTDLQSILDTINALPDAGSGGTVETCTVTITDQYGDYGGDFYLTVFEDGEIKSVEYNPWNDYAGTITVENVVKNSLICLATGGVKTNYLLSYMYVTPLSHNNYTYGFIVLDDANIQIVY